MTEFSMSIIHRIFSILFALSCVSTSALSVPLTDFAIESVDSTRLPVTIQPPLHAPVQLATAIILNTNARSVTNDLEALATSIFGSDHVFVTTNEKEARHAASATLHYKLVIPVGGDGTLSSLVNYMCEELLLIVQSSKEEEEEYNPCLEQVMQQLPLMGYIPMGTGNGVGSVVGCRLPRKGLLRSRRKRLRQLKQIMEQLQKVGQDLLDDTVPAKVNMTIIPMPMIEVQTYHKDDESSSSIQVNSTNKGALCFFAGVGFDSLMLNDFKALKAWSQRTGILKRALGSVTGYCVALVTMTLPQCVMQNKHKIRVKLTTRCKEETLWIDHRRGDFAQRVDADDTNNNDGDRNGITLLYEGAAGILAVGTSPFYGGGLRLFPFARIYPDKMHLRLGRIHPLKGFLNIPRIFEGSYRDDDFGCLDFLGNDFEVEVRQDNNRQEQGGYPFQHSGESAGYVERFRLRLVKEPVRFVSFLPKRVIVPDKSK
jgi:Diacylglycerol kinase catalytic domain